MGTVARRPSPVWEALTASESDSRYGALMLFEPVFGALNAAGVRYLIAGGVAVVLHGHVRFTADLDLAVDLSEAQARAAVVALGELGLKPRLPVDPLLFADAQVRQQWVEEKGATAFTLYDPSNPLLVVDLFIELPMDFEHLWARSIQVDVGQCPVRVVSRADLIAMKRDTGRAKDAVDVEELRALAELEDEGP